MVKKNLVVADICNTLFDSNTTFDFIKYCVETGKIKHSTLLYEISLERNLPLYWLLVLLNKMTKKDLHKTIAVALLKNSFVQTVDEWACEFYEKFLNKHVLSQSIDILKMYEKEKIVLVSSTIHPIAGVIAKQLGFDQFIATELESQKGRYTGNIAKEISGRKLMMLTERYGGAGFSIETIITDNFTDKELVLCSDKKFTICYNNKQERFWKKIPGVNIIRINKLLHDKS
jgi:phosphoserine phosphatase